MKRKQQFLKTASIFGHNYNRKPYNNHISNIWHELRKKALHLAYNLPDTILWDFSITEILPGEREYNAQWDKHNYRHTRKLIRRGKISKYGNRKYLTRECDLRELKRYLKKTSSDMYKAAKAANQEKRKEQ